MVTMDTLSVVLRLPLPVVIALDLHIAQAAWHPWLGICTWCSVCASTFNCIITPGIIP